MNLKLSREMPVIKATRCPIEIRVNLRQGGRKKIFPLAHTGCTIGKKYALQDSKFFFNCRHTAINYVRRLIPKWAWSPQIDIVKNKKIRIAEFQRRRQNRLLLAHTESLGEWWLIHWLAMVKTNSKFALGT